MRYILTPTLLITLTIVLTLLVPRIAGADTVFVSVLDFNGALCFKDFHTTAPTLDPKEELSDGMDFAAVTDNASFRGIMRRDKLNNRGLSECFCAGGELPPCS